jgi:FtsZ-binding cell division protein ZapB
LAPVQDGRNPGDAGYNYYAATNEVNATIKSLQVDIDALSATNTALNVMRAKATVTLSHADANAALNRQNRRIQAEDDEKQAKIAAVLREMGLN